jgi:hypothetical protein
MGILGSSNPQIPHLHHNNNFFYGGRGRRGQQTVPSNWAAPWIAYAMADEKKETCRHASSPGDLPDGPLSLPRPEEGATEPTPSPPSSETGQNAPPPGPTPVKAKPPHPMAKFAVYRSPPPYETPYNVDKKLYAKRVMLPANITLQREQTQTLTNEVGSVPWFFGGRLHLFLLPPNPPSPPT